MQLPKAFDDGRPTCKAKKRLLRKIDVDVEKKLEFFFSDCTNNRSIRSTTLRAMSRERPSAELLKETKKIDTNKQSKEKQKGTKIETNKQIKRKKERKKERETERGR